MRTMLEDLFSSEGFMPHGMCYLWDPALIRLHVASDLVIGLAYWAIPPTLLLLVLRTRRLGPGAEGRRRGLPFDWIFVAFGVFIIACGTTHFLEAWNVWHPDYWLSGSVKVVTAAASALTALVLPPQVPKVLRLVEAARTSESRRTDLEAAHSELADLYSQLKDLDNLKSQLFANVSHELRTPLTLILSPLTQLLERDQLSPDDRRELTVVLRNAQVLARQVDDLLLVARLDAGRLEPTPTATDPVALVRRVVGHFEFAARERRIDLQLDLPELLEHHPLVVTDPDLVERVLFNLLGNGLKFTPEGGALRISMRSDLMSEDALEARDAAAADTAISTATDAAREAPAAAPDDRPAPRGKGSPQLRIEVADSGPGIPEELRGAVFERFRRGGTALRRADGTGLGLAIARELVTLLDGEIKVTTAPEGGALFQLQLPALRALPGQDLEPYPADRDEDASIFELQRAIDGEPFAPSPLAGAEPEPLTSPSRLNLQPVRVDAQDRPTVLVIEDHRDLARHLSTTLASEYRVLAAGDGPRGLAMAWTHRPDAILCDIMMPGMDGEEVVRRLRSDPILEPIPVLVLTAKSDERLRLRLLAGGAQDFMLKPFSVEELRVRLHNLLELKRSRDLLQQELDSQEESLEVLARVLAERKRSLEQALEERALLLRELHHRVKGNLQTIGSLLHLRSRTLRGDEARNAIDELRGRVSVMGQVHERLYSVGGPARLDFATYAQNLVTHLVRYAGPPGLELFLDFETTEAGILVPLELDGETAIPAGLILHELVTNALRHAFAQPGSGAGGGEGSGDEVPRLEVRLHPVASGEPRSADADADAHAAAADDAARAGSADRPALPWRQGLLVVRDNGVGFDPQLSPGTGTGTGAADPAPAAAASSLGLTLVHALAEQIDAVLELDTTDGTRWALRFDLAEPVEGGAPAPDLGPPPPPHA